MTIGDSGGLEHALARTEADADAALKSATALTKELKRAKKAAATGVLRDLERALDAAETLAGTLRDSVRSARAGWRFDDRQYLESGAFTAELLAAADRARVKVIEQDDRLVSYPSLVRVLPTDAALDIDRKRLRTIRPSVIVEHLRKAQTRPVRLRPQQFLETLLRAYRLVLAESGRDLGAPVRVTDIYRVLTLLPGSSYTKQEFARDLYHLEESGETRTRDGFRISFAAATGTKGSNYLTAVTSSGDLKPYYVIAFHR